MKEFYPNVPKIAYKGPGGDAMSFKFYNPDEMIDGKSLKDGSNNNGSISDFINPDK